MIDRIKRLKERVAILDEKHKAFLETLDKDNGEDTKSLSDFFDIVKIGDTFDVTRISDDLPKEIRDDLSKAIIISKTEH